MEEEDFNQLVGAAERAFIAIGILISKGRFYGLELEVLHWRSNMRRAKNRCTPEQLKQLSGSLLAHVRRMEQEEIPNTLRRAFNILTKTLTTTE